MSLKTTFLCVQLVSAIMHFGCRIFTFCHYSYFARLFQMNTFSTDNIPYMHWWPALNEIQHVTDLPSDDLVLVWREYAHILALAKCAHISLVLVASLVGYYVDYNLVFYVIKHVYYGEYLFGLVTHCNHFWLTQCGPKVLGLIFFKIEGTWGRHIPFFYSK